MTEKRFDIEEGYYQGKTRPMIFDDESSDDYYFCGDYEDFKSICEKFNDFDITNKHLKKEIKELKEERKGFESCSHNWGILYDEAKNAVRELDKENQELRKQLILAKPLYSRRELERKNKELKYKYDEQSNEKMGLEEDVDRLSKENRELKLQLEAFKDKLCELGVSDVKLYGKRYYTGLEEQLNDL